MSFLYDRYSIIDNDPYNNKAINLQWVTQSENIQRAYDQGRKRRNKGIVNGRARFTEKDILEKYGLSVDRILDQFKLFQGYYEQVK